MDSIIGTVVNGKVTDENDEAYFIQYEGQTMVLDKTETDKPLHIGGQFEGFVYENEDHHLQITPNVPAISFDNYAWGTVVRSRHDLGVFVDVGLANKDIVVSLDELPTINNLWPQKGDRLLIKLRIDKKERLWGTLAEEQYFEEQAKTPEKGMAKNQDVTGTVYRLKMTGTFVWLDTGYIGFVHPSERDAEPRLGQRVKARVIGSGRNHEFNLSLRPRGYEVIGDDAAMLLAALEHQETHELPFWDKSEPEAIRNYFGISKAQFKRALGNLLKRGAIEKEPGAIKLTPAGLELAGAQHATTD